ncbi:Uncharacterised protein [Zhongshania aliphaticivorans]|uniref:Cupin 2 conserved barrel domain-containing protein n=2 Tax=Zhongshania aliphaticivorans TaxID=1470434 RepID=A0A5S9NI38_9GAMM|nr:hypothetical protein [Zhongshania aliphaticivorans]CAA0090240.1 Uncharacterised protein [Zhongshania aliphaticivorans]CAA0097638.1 Uncharacterised protein [Zhongshania aliphaticivorans]
MRLPAFILRHLQAKAEKITRRAPNKVIGTDYLTRWYIIPRNRLFNVYLHQVCGDDPDINLHDHPWIFNSSVVLRGRILEEMPDSERILETGSFTTRAGRAPHRLLLKTPDSLTLFLTGPKIRKWGFYTPTGWVNSKVYLPANGNGRKVTALHAVPRNTNVPVADDKKRTA